MSCLANWLTMIGNLFSPNESFSAVPTELLQGFSASRSEQWHLGYCLVCDTVLLPNVNFSLVYHSPHVTVSLPAIAEYYNYVQDRCFGTKAMRNIEKGQCPSHWRHRLMDANRFLKMSQRSSLSHQPFVTFKGRQPFIFDGLERNFLQAFSISRFQSRNFKEERDGELCLLAGVTWGSARAEGCALWVLLLAEEFMGVEAGWGDKDAHEKCFCVGFASFLHIPSGGKSRKTGTVNSSLAIQEPTDIQPKSWAGTLTGAAGYNGCFWKLRCEHVREKGSQPVVLAAVALWACIPSPCLLPLVTHSCKKKVLIRLFTQDTLYDSSKCCCKK